MISAPEKICRRLIDLSWKEITVGYSGAKLFRISGGHVCYYLKHMASEIEKSLTHEAEVMIWLAGKLPVPEVVEYVTDETGEYLLMTEIPGKSFAELIDSDPEWLAEAYAESLLKIHGLSIKNCPFNESNDVKLNRALVYCDNGLVKPEYFREDRQGMSIKDIRTRLIKTNSFQEDFVFTHGDYCFPNVILNGNQLSGYVDWSSAGVADRYQDISIGERSIKYNLHKLKKLHTDEVSLAVDVFRKTYGIKNAEIEKIEFYQLLDDFFR